MKVMLCLQRDDCDTALKNVVRHFKKAKGQWGE